MSETQKQPDAPVAKPPITKLTYMPLPGDSDHVTLRGVTMRAYEPVDLDPDQGEKLDHLASNPWFAAGDASGEKHDARKKAWDAHREAHKSAADAKRTSDGVRDDFNRANAIVSPGPVRGQFDANRAAGVDPEKPGVAIVPTVGRVVWFWPAHNPNLPAPDNDQPCAAIIAKVIDARLVNLSVITHEGAHVPYKNVQLVQEGDVAPHTAFCGWMPYQLGQAKKNGPLPQPNGVAVHEAGAASEPADASPSAAARRRSALRPDMD